MDLDSLTSIDSILIVWPDQKYQVIKNIPANKQLLVKQKDAVQNFDYHNFFQKPKELFEDITNQVNVDWKHKENDFNDFNVQYLIPHKESTRGPKIAVADVNKDGLDDFYACGAKGQAGLLNDTNKRRNVYTSDTALFNKEQGSAKMWMRFF